MKWRWNRTMLNFCGIVAAILKMATSRNFSTNSTLFDFSVLNWFPTSKNFYRSPFSKRPPQYRKISTLFDFKGSFWFIF
jgi:hypothetical protein